MPELGSVSGSCGEKKRKMVPQIRLVFKISETVAGSILVFRCYSRIRIWKKEGSGSYLENVGSVS